jgi:hypothetical protein
MVYCGPYGTPEPNYYACAHCHYRPTDDELLSDEKGNLRHNLSHVKVIAQESEKCARFEVANAALQDNIEAVRALHVPDEPKTYGDDLCLTCKVPLPCPTITALDSAKDVYALLENKK